MAELEPGHPDELLKLLTNWLKQANEPDGKLLPEGIAATEWAVRQFIRSWRKPVRDSIDSIESLLHEAIEAIDRGDAAAAKGNIDAARQTLGEDLRDELGLYEWNRESE